MAVGAKACPAPKPRPLPAWNPPSEVMLHGFSFTLPSREKAPTFIVAGCGELRGGPMLEAEVIRAGETGPEAMREKASYVIHNMWKRLAGLEVSWDDVTCTDVYTMQPFLDLAGAVVVDRMGVAMQAGLRSFPSRPPIDELEFELATRGVRRELVIG